MVRRHDGLALSPSYQRLVRAAGHARRRMNLALATQDFIFNTVGSLSATSKMKGPWENDVYGCGGEILMRLLLNQPLVSLVKQEWHGDHVRFTLDGRTFGVRTTVYETGMLALPTRVDRDPAMPHLYGYALVYVGQYPWCEFRGWATYHELIRAPYQEHWKDPAPALRQSKLHWELGTEWPSDFLFTSARPLEPPSHTYTQGGD